MTGGDRSGPRLRVGERENTTARTVVEGRSAQEFDDRRQAMQRVLLIGCIAYPLFFFADWLGAWTGNRLETLLWLFSLRGIGVVVVIATYLEVRRRRVTSGWLTAIDFGIFWLGAIIISLQSIQLGGLNSRHILGVMTIAFVRASLLPSHWTRTLAVATSTALIFPIVLGVTALFDPQVRAQWASASALGEFAYTFVVLLGGVVVCSFGSHMGWAARRQVMEARKLGSYRLKARIGGGGNGDVWLARQDPLGRPVALKVLKERGATDVESIRRFEREARAASTLKHPNTIRIYEFGASDDGVLFIAMELLDGLDLDMVVMTAGPLPVARALRFARQACGSLAEAHDAGIVHRDIKPANFFVTRAGDDFDFLKLLDFGVARVALGNKPSTLTETGIMFGTPSYMSPEVCGAEAADARSDVYSLGAVVYFMLTATALFPGRTFSETVMSHVSKTPETPSVRLGAPVPADVETIVMRCLAKAPADRYQTVRELEDALARCECAEGWSKDDAKTFWKSMRPSVQLRVADG